MKQTKKSTLWHCGMKAHIGTGTQGCTVVVVTPATTHDAAVMDACLMLVAVAENSQSKLH